MRISSWNRPDLLGITLMRRPGHWMIWVALAAAIALPLGLAAQSPLLAYRSPVYITAGFAGIVAMALLLVQPLLGGGGICRACPDCAAGAFIGWSAPGSSWP